MAAASSSGRQVYISAGRHSYVTQSAMVAVLKAVRDHGLPERISRQTLKRTRQQELPKDTALGDLWRTIELELQDGSSLSLPVVSPLPLLQVCVSRSPQFCQFLAEKLGANDNEKDPQLQVLLYCDEVVPGNVLKGNNQRKLVSFYWSVGQYGASISREDLWMHICAVRSSRLKDVKSTYSQVFKKIASLFFDDPFDLRKGVMLTFPGERRRMVFGRITMVEGVGARRQHAGVPSASLPQVNLDAGMRLQTHLQDVENGTRTAGPREDMDVIQEGEKDLSWLSDVLRQLVSRTLAQQMAQHRQNACSPDQYALSTRAGTECLAPTEADREATALSVDGVGAFDHVSRALASHERLAPQLPCVRQFYGQASQYLWYDDDDAAHVVQQGEGGELGDPLDAWPDCARTTREGLSSSSSKMW